MHVIAEYYTYLDCITFNWRITCYCWLSYMPAAHTIHSNLIFHFICLILKLFLDWSVKPECFFKNFFCLFLGIWDYQMASSSNHHSIESVIGSRVELSQFNGKGDYSIWKQKMRAIFNYPFLLYLSNYIDPAFYFV